MHNLTKISVFRILLRISYPFALVLVYPFSLIRKKNPTGLFFFFDRYCLGGAQRVHLDILEATGTTYKQVYFTRLSPDMLLKGAFWKVPNALNSDIHFWTDNLLFRLFSVHYFAFYINRHPGARVLGANSTFFYDLLPWLDGEKVERLELLHNFTFGKNGMEFFGLANHRFLEQRLLIDPVTRNRIVEQYKAYDVDPAFNSRLRVIEFGVTIPAPVKRSARIPLKVLYAGRGGPQKRIYLINRIAERAMEEGLKLEFHFAGTMMEELTDSVRMNAVLHGQIESQEEMYRLYRETDILLMTSAYEGFPVSIKEAMANGCVPLVTALEGNKIHLEDGENAVLIDAIDDEEAVVEEGLEALRNLCASPEILSKLSENAVHYARKHFSKDQFMNAYRTILVESTK